MKTAFLVAMSALLLLLLVASSGPRGAEAQMAPHMMMRHLDPFGGLGNLFEDDLFSTVFNPTARRQQQLQQHHHHIPPTQVLEAENEYRVVMELPGWKRSEITVEVEGKTLSVSGNRNPASVQEKEHKKGEEKGEGVLEPQEKTLLWEGSASPRKFTRTFQLPDNADMDQVMAKQVDGLLTVVVPKKEKEVPKRRVLHVGEQ